MTRRSLTLALIATATLCTQAGFTGQKITRTLLVRIENASPVALQKTGILNFDEYDYRSIISSIRDTTLAIVTPAERTLLAERGIPSTLIMEDSSELNLIRRAMYGPAMKLPPPYHSYEHITRIARELEKSYPNLVKVSSIGTTTTSKQPIIALWLGKDVHKPTDKPAVLINGCHHSNEVLGAEIATAAATMLATNYGKDPETTRWLDNLRIVIVPVVNPDGHDVVSSGTDPRWRKNTRDTDTNGALNYPDGIDLNRNYDFNWAFGGSHDASTGRYRGPHPFSEAEPRAFAQLARAERFLLSITYHSQGEVIYYPWNWRGHAAPDDSLLTPMAHALAGSIRTMRGDTSYRAEHGAALVGQSYPWLYGTLGTLDFIVETGRGAAIFPPHEVPGIVNANLNGIRTMLRHAEGPGVRFHTTDARSGKAIEATVHLPAIETEAVHRRTTNPRTGSLYRFLTPSRHLVVVSAPGYSTAVLKDVTPPTSGWKTIEIPLTPERP